MAEVGKVEFGLELISQIEHGPKLDMVKIDSIRTHLKILDFEHDFFEQNLKNLVGQI